MLAIAIAFADAAPPAREYIGWDEAKPIVAALHDSTPPELGSGALNAAAWDRWVRNHDQNIRERLVRGEEDSLVHLLLLGTSFTKAPRITGSMLEQLENGSLTTDNGDNAPRKLLERRLNDLVRGLTHPGENERLSYMRSMLEHEGFQFKTADDQQNLASYIESNLSRVIEETRRARAATIQPKGDSEGDTAGDPPSGISLETSLMPNFALEQAMRDLVNHGALKAGSVHRVAIIGPGLDFVDHQEGYDFYPPQTIQPFAVVDSLLRLGLSNLDSLSVSALDISPRVLNHLTSADQRAQRGSSYVLNLPLNARVSWKPDALEYWKELGSQIGSATTPAPPAPGLPPVQTRAVKVKPQVVLHIRPEDVNVVCQHLRLAPDDRFDLVIATNVFGYYDAFDQALALDSLQKMIRPGGFLLTNNAVAQVPSVQLRDAGSTTTAYADAAKDRDTVWEYQRPAAP